MNRKRDSRENTEPGVPPAKRPTSGKLAGLKQNLLAERMALEEKMQQLQRRLAAIEVLLEEER